MKLDEKRRVIEVLSVVATHWQPFPVGATKALGLRKEIGKMAWRRLEREWKDCSVCEAATEAAYRLIESSATLRREWFGR